MSAALRTAGLLCGMAVAALSVSSCRDVIGSGDLDAVAELCATLRACYGDDAYDCVALDEAARQASEELRTSFLGGFDPERCLNSCSGSLGCLDHDMFCLRPSVDAACASTEVCCDWSLGLSECVDGACCRRDGVECTAVEDCCGQNCSGGWCGGYECKKVDDLCHSNYECCTKRCDGGACVSLACTEVGDPCIDSGECCKPVLAQANESIEAPEIECRDGTCQVVTEEPCLPQGSPCDAAGDALQRCCDDQPCEAATTGQTFCVGSDCKPQAFDCAQDTDCCAELICRLDFAASVCDVPPGGCTKAGNVCEEDDDCCSSACLQGKCLQGTGLACNPEGGDCHSPAVTGTTINDSCADETGCVRDVKDADVFCACTAWDAICVAAYAACGG